MTGKNVYLCTIKYHGNEYGVREYPEANKFGSMLYCSPSVDHTHPMKITVNTDDHDVDYILGGGQENNMCSGTQGMPAIAGFAAAVENGGSVEKNLKYVAKLNLRLRERIKEIPGVHINSPENALPYIINISIDEIPSQVSVNFFSMNGVYISAGSACSKGHRSNVLQSMGLPPDRIDSAIRISLSNDTSIDEIDRCADVIKIAVEKLRKHKG